MLSPDREIRLPDSINEISNSQFYGSEMFRNCQSLTTVWITNKDTVINDLQVNQQKAIKLKNIQDPTREFSNDPNERAMLYKVRIAYQKLLEMTIFKDCRSLKKIYVPKGSIEIFRYSIPKFLNYLLVESED